MELFLNIVGIAWIAFWLYWLVSAVLTHGRPGNRELFAVRIGLLFLLVAAFIILQPVRSDGSVLFTRFVPDTLLTGTIGVAIAIAGLLVAVWARVHLGQYWSPVAEIKVNHKLIRTGPYQYVRNPIYSGILIGFLGTAIVVGMWIAVLACAVGIAAFLLKIRSEEKLLMGRFGDEYVRYKQEVKSLVPWVL